MTTTIELPMRREETILNLVCLLVAAGFLALVAYNLFAAGSIISTDGLFMIVVPLVLALPFLLVPGRKVIAGRLERRALKHGDAPPQIAAGAQPKTGTPALKSAPALKDTKGRAMPPDVNRMVAEMSKAEKSEQ